MYVLSVGSRHLLAAGAVNRQDWIAAVGNDILRDLTCRHPLNRRYFVHNIAHNALDDGAQTARSRFVCERFLSDETQRIILEGEADSIEFQKLLKLLNKSVFRLRQNTNQRLLIK